MKNLLIYINPRKGFDSEHARYAEIQIENSRKFWDKKDLLLVTNFPYSYSGIDAMVVPDDLYCEVHNKASKVNTIIYLLEQGVLDELTWFHDLDAFQLQPMDSTSIEREVGFTDYGWSPKWNTGSIFFKPSSVEVFRWLKDAVYALQTDEERALRAMTKDATHPINDYYERMNITYNFGMRNIADNLRVADKPLMVVHFHPYRQRLLKKFKPFIPDDLYEKMAARA